MATINLPQSKSIQKSTTTTSKSYPQAQQNAATNGWKELYDYYEDKVSVGAYQCLAALKVEDKSPAEARAWMEQNYRYNILKCSFSTEEKRKNRYLRLKKAIENGNTQFVTPAVLKEYNELKMEFGE